MVTIFFCLYPDNFVSFSPTLNVNLLWQRKQTNRIEVHKLERRGFTKVSIRGELIGRVGCAVNNWPRQEVTSVRVSPRLGQLTQRQGMIVNC